MDSVLLNELCRLFRRNMPEVVRSDESVEALFTHEGNKIIEHREDGALRGACVFHIRESKGTVLLLAVDEACRNRGIGSALLARAEAVMHSVGVTDVNIGVGFSYLCPGVPILRDNVEFFTKRGYRHGWEDGSECFDMETDLANPPSERPGHEKNGIIYRFAGPEDEQLIEDCLNAGHPSFIPYYHNPVLYGASNQHAVVAEDNGIICGVVMARPESERPETGSIGCTAVRTAYRGRGIATEMVKTAVGWLAEQGMKTCWLGYTYTGLDKMYGASGFVITTKYMMAEKKL